MKYNDVKFLNVAEPIINNLEFQKMKDLKHHNESVYEHVVDVAYRAYRITYKCNLDWEATIRGALLHDFHLYTFDKTLRMRLPLDVILHIFRHPYIALENAQKNFQLNSMEKNIILSHMFPFRLPKFTESWIVSFVDKFMATYEYGMKLKRLINKKLETA